MAKVNVLLVDDEKPFVETLTKRLTKRGLEISAAYDGPGALSKLAEDHTLEVVILRAHGGDESTCGQEKDKPHHGVLRVTWCRGRLQERQPPGP